MARMPTGAEVIVSLLEDAGVQVCFGLPGVHNLALWEALRASPIRLVGVRHEQTAAYAADGYARATGRLGVALTTTGPGAANTLGAVGEAWASRSPVLVIATDIPSTLRRAGAYRGVLHETDGQAAMFAPVVKSVNVVGSPGGEDVGVATETALMHARWLPSRPVYLEVPTDLLAAPAHAPGAEWTGYAHLTPPIADAAAMLDTAEAPLIWVGGGGRDAPEEVRALAERLAAPVLTTYGAAGVLPPDHPCLVGLPPHVPAAGALWDAADVVVAIGSDLDGVQTQNFAQPQPPRLIAINAEAHEPDTNYRVDVKLHGDAAQLTGQLAEAVAPRIGLDGVAQRLREVRAQACAMLDARALRFLDAIRFALPDDGVVVADMCIPGYWLAGFHTPSAPRRLQVPLGWGTLGYAFPAAIGAALAATGPVISISGDGGFLYACGELATVAQEAVPLTAVVVDDGGYGMLRYDQDTAGEARYGVDLVTPDFAALAASFGVRAETVDGLEDDFGAALAEHVADPDPSLLVARTPEPLIPPPNTSPNWYRRR
ncbi:MAG: 5-guanidino-2-oxopentanoate decarboxylase [Baekduia sp.]|jgi:thiamine pyrophosphate-dependent acetolactate synthase large subunit-like protein|nr:5-guanidino-2-oxopentanoate decarboxylase [Baekduia sp.]MEA2281427.1 5-guanidino-2-oxopentanoate decarboxylase [Solirubrobacteraceae bacterium]